MVSRAAPFPRAGNSPPSDGVTIRPIDRRGQEDTRLVSFTGAGEQAITLAATQAIDLSRETNAQLSLVIEYRVDLASTAPAFVGINQARVPVTQALSGPDGRMAHAGDPARLLRQGRGGHEQGGHAILNRYERPADDRHFRYPHRERDRAAGSMQPVIRIMLAGTALLSGMALAAPAIDPMFGDQAVIQREKPIHIRGTAAPNERVTVNFGRCIEECPRRPSRALDRRICSR